ncbi:MAG: O-antigen ligase family protein, partial [Cellulosilyticaceae bacterium]
MLIGLTVVAFMFYKPIYGLYLTVFIAPILPTKIMLVVCAVVAASVVVRNLVDSTHKWHLDDVGFLLIALLIMYGIGVIVSFTPMSSLAVWFVYMIFIGFYVIMMQLLEDKRTIFTLIKVFVISGTLVAVYGILQYVFGWGVNENWIDPNVFSITKRAYSTLENPNILGEYLILTVLAGTGLMVTRKTWMARIGYAGCTGLMIICLMATFSRGCWLGVGFAIAVFITFYNGKLWAASIPLLLVAPLVLPDSVIHRFTSIGNMEDTSTAIRVKIWLSSLGMGTDFMLTGLGLGTAAYAFVYPFYAYYYIPAHHSHNAFFQVLIEGGIIGLILFIGIIWRFVKHMTLTYKRELTKDKTVSFMVLALAAGVGGFFIQGMFDYSFYNYRMVLIFWLFVAMGTALAKVSQKEMHQ